MSYEVYGEVKTVDVIAKHDKMIIPPIELKLDFTITLITQGAKRQKLSDFVYIAIPKPTSKVQKGPIYKDKLVLLKRLGLGLIHVDVKKNKLQKLYRNPL